MNSLLFRFLRAGWPWGWLTLAAFIAVLAMIPEW